jgi:hypothetical protein
MDFYFVWTPWDEEPEDRYLWEIFPCCDGILLSKGYVTGKFKHVCCEILEMLNQLSEYAPCGYKPITTLEVEKLKNEWLKTADEVKR